MIQCSVSFKYSDVMEVTLWALLMLRCESFDPLSETESMLLLMIMSTR